MLCGGCLWLYTSHGRSGPFSTLSQYSSAFEFPVLVLVMTMQGTPTMPPGTHPHIPSPDHAHQPFLTTHSSPH